MDDINLFLELNNIKMEITNDLSRLNDIQNFLNVNELYKSNQDLSEKICILNDNCTKKLNNFKNQIDILKNENLKINSNLISKEEEINKLKKQINEMNIIQKDLEYNLNESKNDYKQLKRQLNKDNNQFIEVINDNKKFIKSLFK
jgi:chromosome segregation ATPase